MSLAGPDDLLDAAQRVAGVFAARTRGDAAGARALLESFDEQADLAAGAMVVAELSLGLLSRATEEELGDCVAGLCRELMTLPRG